MIIGNNNGMGKPNFIGNNKGNNNQNMMPKKTNNQMSFYDPSNERTSNMIHSNVMNKNEMSNKSFAMLQERLKNGSITIEEFNKKCVELGKHSQ